MELNIRGKNVLITGGARGIGKGLVEVFMRENANVIFTYNSSEDKAKEIVESYKEHSSTIRAFQMDICNVDDVEIKVDEIIGEYGKIDILINNAGITADGYLMLMSSNNWNNVVNTNLNGTYIMSKKILPNMIRNKSGCIINMASVSGIFGVAGQTNYGATKAAIVAMTKALCKEVGSKKIRVNAIAPGYIETDMLAAVNEKVRNEYKKKIPLKEFGTPEDVANTALFLASDMAKYINGETIVVDGGITA